MNKEIEPFVSFKELNANDIFALTLNIPEYQRIYTWEQEQVKTLLDDILTCTVEKYYVGSAILHMTKDQNEQDIYDIVDGQQRLVTTAIIKYSLAEDISKLPNGYARFLTCKYYSLEAQSNIFKNHHFIKEYLADDQKKKVINDNINRLTFGVLIIQNNENLDLAFTFFSNTNSKGRKLTDYDLLKPHHLRYIPSDLEKQQRHLATKWDIMIRSNRSIESDSEVNSKNRDFIPYIRVMEYLLFRLRNWSVYNDGDESIDHYIKKEFEAAPIIEEIPPFGEQFHYDEPIQGGQHFFSYVDFFVQQYHNFKMKEHLQRTFGQEGTHSWYGTIIEALVFCYYLKFGVNYINEVTMAIVRFISIIRFRKGRAYKRTISDWARSSKIAIEINKATSPTFILAAIENLIDKELLRDEPEDASKGVRKHYLNCCREITELLSKQTITEFYHDYYQKRYGKFN